MKTKFKFMVSILFLAITFFITSCSGIMGYSVLLWSLPGKSLSDGDIVPVYILSNINNVYVIGIPGSDEKLELPLWQVTEPVSKGHAKEKQAVYAEYQHKYATVMRDGLPIRKSAANNAKQVYRLRKDEVIKVLYKGDGQIPMTGGKPLPGEWLYVMASDGTAGWCFSYNLSVFDEREEVVEVESTDDKSDELLEKVLSKRWYPENYEGLISSGKIDFNVIKAQYGFDTGTVSSQIQLLLPEVTVRVPFSGITHKNANVYKFNNAPFILTIRNENVIIVQYTNEKGMPTAYTFIAMDENIEDVIAGELERRKDVYNTLLGFGPRFSSSNYGTLNFYEDSLFSWNGYRRLVSAGVIPSSTNGNGSVEIKYFLSKNLSVSFDGILTLKFENTDKEINFLYKLEEKGLRLETVENTRIQRSTVSSRASNPLVMFFAKME